MPSGKRKARIIGRVNCGITQSSLERPWKGANRQAHTACSGSGLKVKGGMSGILKLNPAQAAEAAMGTRFDQSGGLGVPSSNLGAPTNIIKDFRRENAFPKLALGSIWEASQLFRSRILKSSASPRCSSRSGCRPRVGALEVSVLLLTWNVITASTPRPAVTRGSAPARSQQPRARPRAP